MKRILITSLILSLRIGITFSQTILQPGDIAIVGYNFKNPDEFSFITFLDLDPGTVIYFTDCGWTSSNSFRVGEGIVTYTVPSEGKKAGNVITFGLDPGFTTSGVSGFFGLSTTGDQLLVYQGTFSAPQFIYALNCSGNAVWQTSAADNNSSALPQGLENGYSAVALVEKEDGVFNCLSDVTDKASLLPLISDFNNWAGDDNNRFTLPPPCFLDPLSEEIIEVSAHMSEGFLTLQLNSVPGKTGHYFLELSKDYIQYDSFAAISISESRIYYSFHFSVDKNYTSLRLKSEKSGKIYGSFKIENSNEQIEVKICPNPYSIGLLEIMNLQAGTEYYLQVINRGGQVLLIANGSEESIKAMLYNFAVSADNGIYFVIIHDQIKIYHEKLIIE